MSLQRVLLSLVLILSFLVNPISVIADNNQPSEESMSIASPTVDPQDTETAPEQIPAEFDDLPEDIIAPTDQSSCDATLKLEASSTTVTPGDTIELSFGLSFVTETTPGQLEIVLPKGVSAKEPLIWDISEDYAQTVQVQITEDILDLDELSLTFTPNDYAWQLEESIYLTCLGERQSYILQDQKSVTTSNDRLGVDFGKADLADLYVEVQPLSIAPYSAQTSDEMLYTVEVDAWSSGEKDAALTSFETPVTMRINMDGIVDIADLPTYQAIFAGYLDEETGKWEILPAHREGNTVTFETNHFSIFGVGTVDVPTTGWALAYNEPQVSLFSGGMTYSYPIELVAGRNGATPDVTLTYNSRRVDGILTWVQSDWVGMGWTLDTMEIVRKITPDYAPASSNYMDYSWLWGYTYWENEFVLMYQGTAYTLIPQQSNRAYGLYSCEDEQFLRIQRFSNVTGCTGSSANATGEYWIVTTKDGTQYQLGYNADSEQTVSMNSSIYQVPANPNESNYAGQVSGKVTYRWRLDKITYLNGERITYEYAESAITSGSAQREYASYLTAIRYNYTNSTSYNNSVLFDRALRSSDSVGDTDTSTDYYYQDYYLRGIRVQSWNTSTQGYETIREYRLSYQKQAVNSGEHDPHLRLLTSIQEYGRGGYGSSSSLPATTFSYTRYENKTACSTCTHWFVPTQEWQQECFRYSRLTAINNGYHGTTELGYETPDSGWWHAQNYRVITTTVSDGQGGGYRYAYCYPSALTDRGYDLDDTYGCDYYSSGEETGDTLVGYHWVIVDTQDISGNTLSKSSTEFRMNSTANPDRSVGRVYVLIDYVETATGWLTYNKQINTYTTNTTTFSSGASSYFVGQSQATYYRYDDGSERHWATQYWYDNYGNVSQIREYSDFDVETLYRCTYINYAYNTGSWIVSLPCSTEVFNGFMSQISGTYIYYDNTTTLGAAPSQGLVTKTARWNGTVQQQTTEQIRYITVAGGISVPDRTTDAHDKHTTVTYARDGLIVTSITNSEGHVTTYSYDPGTMQVTRVNGPNTDDSNWEANRTTAHLHDITDYQYDVFGRLTAIIEPGDTPSYPTKVITYNDTANPLTIRTYQRIDSNSSATYSTISVYDGLGRLIQENSIPSDNSSAIVHAYTYSPLGVAREYEPFSASYSTGKITIPSGTAYTSYTYDDLGRVTEIASPDGTSTTYAYKSTNTTFKTICIDANGHQTMTEQDIWGHTVASHEYEGTFSTPNWSASAYNTVTYTYDALDHLLSSDDGPSETTMEYDDLGRKIMLVDPDLGTWYYAYDTMDRLIGQEDARNQWTYYYYDDLGRLIGEYCPPSTPSPTLFNQGNYSNSQSLCTVTYHYDNNDPGNMGVGQLHYVENGDGSHSYEYDGRGRVLTETRVTYDSNHNDESSLSLRRLLNSANQITCKLFTDHFDSRAYIFNLFYTYDNYGRLDTMADSQSTPGTSSAAYNAYGLLDTLSDSKTISISSTDDYDAYARLVPPQPTSTIYVSNADYDVYGRLTSLVYGNGTSTTYTYNSPTVDGGRLASITSVKYFPSTSIQNLVYDYDNVGNVTQIINHCAPGGTQTTNYTYDELDRLSSAVATGGSNTYSYAWTYEQNGNIASLNSSAWSYNADPDHGVSTAQASSANFSQINYGYDLNGNVVSRSVLATLGGTTTTYQYSYDEQNELESITRNSASLAAFGVLEGELLKSTVNGTTTYYIGSDAEYSQGSSLVRTYNCYFGDQLVAVQEVVGNPIFPSSTNLTYLYHDHLGSTTVAIDATTSKAQYLPYGGRLDSVDLGTSYTYTGQQALDGLDILNYGARWYDPLTGRFLQPDTIVPQPFNPQSLNRYAYCLNNPIKYTDPTGHGPFEVLETLVGEINYLGVEEYEIFDIMSDGDLALASQIFSLVEAAGLEQMTNWYLSRDSLARSQLGCALFTYIAFGEMGKRASSASLVFCGSLVRGADGGRIAEENPWVPVGTIAFNDRLIEGELASGAFETLFRTIAHELQHLADWTFIVPSKKTGYISDENMEIYSGLRESYVNPNEQPYEAYRTQLVESRAWDNEDIWMESTFGH